MSVRQRQEVQELPRPSVANLRPRLILGAVAFANLVVAALHFGLAAAGPAVRDLLELSTSSLGLLLAAPAVGLMVGTYGWGLLADRTSERRVLAGAFAGFAFAAFAGSQYATPDDVWSFVVMLFLAGLFGSAAHSAGGRVISSAFPPHRHGLVLSIRHVAIPLGGAVGGIAVPWLVERHGLAVTMQVATTLGIVAAVGVAAAIPSSRGARALAREDPNAVRGASPLRLRSMWMLAVGAGSLAFVQLGIGSFLTVQLVDRGQLALATAAVIYTVAQLLAGTGRVVLGVWSDRMPSRIALLQRVSIVTLVLTVAAALVDDPSATGLVLAAAFVVVTSCNGVVVAVAASLAPPGRTGATLGMQTTANAFACALAPISLGIVIDEAGWHAYVAVLIGALAVSAACLRLLRAHAAPGPGPATG